MNRLNRACAVLACAVSLAFVGCAKDTLVNNASPTDQQYFDGVINGSDASNSDLAMSDQVALSDGQIYGVAKEQLPPSIQSVVDDHKMHPLKWGRYINGAQRIITKIDLEGDTVAILHVQVTYSGTYVVYGMVNNAPDTLRKPFTVVLHRLFRFVRIAHKDDVKSNWRLDAVSILNGGTANSKITITQMEVLQPTGDLLVATDPDAYFMHISKGGWFMHDLPLWGFNVQVVVTATVRSNDPDTDVVTLHYVPKHDGLHRASMQMASETGDSVNGYLRVYSVTLAIPGNDKKFSHLVVSATTRESVSSTLTSDFSSSVWGLPYKSSE